MLVDHHDRPLNRPHHIHWSQLSSKLNINLCQGQPSRANGQRRCHRECLLILFVCLSFSYFKIFLCMELKSGIFIECFQKLCLGFNNSMLTCGYFSWKQGRRKTLQAIQINIPMVIPKKVQIVKVPLLMFLCHLNLLCWLIFLWFASIFYTT